MRILLSNDDGITSPGIRALAEAFCREHEVYISAPDSERSAVSRSMTIFTPLRAREMRLEGLPDVAAYAVSGTPVDCVRLALGNLFPVPDIVVSGVNMGPNLGTDVLYSGTVAAAHEAALLGYQSIAVSCLSYRGEHIETAARVASGAVEYVLHNPLRFGALLNINVPGLPFEELKGVRLAPACVEQYELKYIEREDPFGVKYYWMPHGRISCCDGMDVDDRWAREGYVTVTPLTYDLTDHARLHAMDGTALDWAGRK